MSRTLPNWPRLLKAELAAAYVGVSKTTFLKDVGTRWPRPVHQGRRRLWDRKTLDDRVDRLAEMEDDSDPLMEAFNDRQN